MTLVGVAPVYTGTAPFASCHYQCLANILEEQGLRGAEGRLCMSWGFGWDGGERLHGSRRWMHVANRVHGIALEEHRFDSIAAARVAERGLLDRGSPFAAAVDSFAIPSEYEGVAHIPHSVIVLGGRQGSVAILDPMNHPEVAWYDHDAYWAMRSHPCVESAVLFTSSEEPYRGADDRALLDALLDDVARHQATGLAVLDAYVSAAGSRPGVDVCRVGAERLYLAAMLRRVGAGNPALEQAARGMGSLARRWYLIHTIALQGGPRERDRCESMIAAMRDRETALVERLHAAAAGARLDGELEVVDDVL